MGNELVPDLILSPEQFEKETKLWFRNCDLGFNDGLELRIKPDGTLWAFKEKYSIDPNLKVLKFIGAFDERV